MTVKELIEELYKHVALMPNGLDTKVLYDAFPNPSQEIIDIIEVKDKLLLL